MRLFAVVTLLVAAAPSWAAEVYTFNLLPANGQISGAPGATIGWGYMLENESSNYWLVTANLGADAFSFGTPQVVFDFPILAPGANVTVPFDAATFSGLFALVWDASAPAGTIESGTFVLDAEWWDGDPLSGGSYVSSAPRSSQVYSATVNAVPEPATTGTFALAVGLLLVAGAIRRHRDSRHLPN